MKMFRLLTISVYLLIPLFFSSACQKEKEISVSDVVVLINTNTSEAAKGTEKVIPYLDHFGIKFKVIDIATEHIALESGNPALVIIAHPQITDNHENLGSELKNYLRQCQSRGTGILSFDPLMPTNLISQPGKEYEKDDDVGELHFSDIQHYVTGYRVGEKKDLFGYMSIPRLTIKEGEVLLTGNGLPLLMVGGQQEGRIAQWTSMDWMYNSVLGPMGGLDDCLWKSIVWAARKPFVMQALPPLVTMRVDDAVGSGRQQWDVSPFQWIKTVNKYGFKPWLGLFIYNIDPEGIRELKALINDGLATAAPHALGRPPRPESLPENFDAYYKSQITEGHFIPDYWYPNALPYQSEYYDEFIFFDHNNRCPWPEETANRILKAVDDWYEETGPLTMSKYLIVHWGECGANMITHIHDKWGIEYLALTWLDRSWGDLTTLPTAKKINKMPRKGPFKLYDEPVLGKPKENATKSRAFYTADFVEHAGKKFFDFKSSINDITGYEWMPDNDIEATVERGMQTIKRGLEAKALAVLFTHEPDYIAKIQPENWDAIFQKINSGISAYNPVYLTTDEAVKIVRAFHTSEIQDSRYDRESGKLTLKMFGKTDVPTSVFVYLENGGEIIEKPLEIPAFRNASVFSFQLLE